MPGACNQNGAVYQVVVATNDGKEESYVGLSKNFKKRFLKHRTTLNSRGADGQTTLSVWNARDEARNPEITMWA